MPHARVRVPPSAAAEPGWAKAVARQAGKQAARERMVRERFCHSSFHQYGSYSFDWKLSWLDYGSCS
jgi:hypothetical protein